MILFLIAFFITLVTAWVWIWIDSKEWYIAGEWVDAPTKLRLKQTLGFGTFIGCMIGLISGMILSMVVSGIIHESNFVSDGGWNIVAVNDRFSTEGEGSFLSFSIGEESRYYYYSYDGSNINQHWVPADRSTIVEDVERPEDAWIEKLIDDQDWLWVIPMEDEPQYVIHVPPGSVVREINFDLQN